MSMRLAPDEKAVYDDTAMVEQTKGKHSRKLTAHQQAFQKRHNEISRPLYNAARYIMAKIKELLFDTEEPEQQAPATPVFSSMPSPPPSSDEFDETDPYGLNKEMREVWFKTKA